jgi:ferric enterobactin receptor
LSITKIILPLIVFYLLTPSNMISKYSEISEVSFSENKNDIRGYIKDAVSGESLVYANVILNVAIGATTNSRGYFVIVDAPIGKSKLLVSYIGYKSQEIPIDNFVGNIKVIQINLSPITYESEEVVVSAEEYKIWKSADEVSQITISPKQLAALPNFGEVDIFRSLQLLPGISGISDGSSGLYIRGGTPDQNLVLLDGMTVYHVDHFFGFFSAFNSEAIKDVQVYKGGYPAKYGGRLSSVVDLTGKTGDVNNFQLSMGANLLSANAVAQIPLSKKGSILLSARRSYADFINSGMYDTIFEFLSGEENTTSDPMQRGGGRGFNQVQTEVLPSFYFYDFNAKISYEISDNDFLSLSFYNGEDYLDESEDPTDLSKFGGENVGTSESTDLTNWGNLGASFKWSRQWSSRLFSDVILSTSNYFSDQNFSTSLNLNVENDSASLGFNSFSRLQENTIDDITLRMDNEWELANDHRLGFGTWISDIKTKYNFIINDTTNIVGTDDSALQVAFYLQDKWKLTNNLELTFGGRSTYFDGTESMYVEPRASFSLKITDRLKLKGAWSHNYQFINQITNEDVLEGGRDFWLVANNDLEPGFAEHFIIGTEFETNGYLFSVEGYYKSLENIIEFTQRIPTRRDIATNSTNTYFANFFTGTGISRGIEFLVQKKFGTLNGWLSYTLGKVENKYKEFNNGETFPANHDRRHEVKIVTAYSIGKWNLSATWIYASGQAYTAPESQYYMPLLNGDDYGYIHVSDKNVYRLPDYHRLDLSASYNFKNKSFNGEFGLSIFNVYNQENIWYKKYDLDSEPIVITDVKMLGITPTVFVKFVF